MSQLEAYLDMDSTDEKMHKKMRQIREKEAKEIGNKQMKEIAKKSKLDAKLKKDVDISESFENTDSKDEESRSKAKTSKLSPEREKNSSRAPTGKGMQLGKPKKIQGASSLSKGFGFDEDKSSFFTPKEEKVEEEKEAQSNQIVELMISESVNCEVNKFGEV